MKYILWIFIILFTCLLTTIANGQKNLNAHLLKDSLSNGINGLIQKGKSLTGYGKQGNNKDSIGSAVKITEEKKRISKFGESKFKIVDKDTLKNRLYSKSKELLDFDSCNCLTVSKRSDSLINMLQPSRIIDKQFVTRKYFRKINKEMAKTGLEKKVSNDKAGQLLRIINLDISEQLLIQPILYKDSASPLIQNIVRSNFAFEVSNSYLFNGYIQYRKTLKGNFTDFWDFNIGYAGKSPVKEVRQSILEKAQRLEVLQEVFKSSIEQIDSAINVVGSEFFSRYAQQVLDARQVVENSRADSAYVGSHSDSLTIACYRKLLSSYDLLTKETAVLQTRRNELQMLLDRCGGAKGSTISQAKIANEILGFKDTELDSCGTNTEDLKKNPFEDLNIKKLSVGRIYPTQSELTLKNTSLKGLDVGFEKGKWIVNVTAGVADFNLNSFWGRTKIEKPVSYTGVFYVGYKISKRLTGGVRYFGGRKNNYAANISNPMISGISAELQAKAKNSSLSMELAKNISQPSPKQEAIEKKSFWNMNDYENMAVAIKASMNIPRTKTSFNGSYALQGKFYNAFNTLSSNIQTNKYDVRIRQDFWRGAIRISAWMRNSEFTPAFNGMLLQNEISLKSFSISFQKVGLPMVSMSYNPVKQVFVSDSSMEVAIYQALTFIGNFQYKLGIRPASFVFSMNQLGGRKTTGSQGYLANSMSFQTTNSIDFSSYVSTLDIGYSKASEYTLLNASSGIDIKLRGISLLKLGLTISKLNEVSSKAGGWLGFETKFGERISAAVNYRLSYQPDLNGTMLRSFNQGNVFVRYAIIK